MPKNVIMRTLAVGLALLLPLATGAWAQEEPAATDEIELKNGSRVIGKVTGIRDGVVTVETDFAGALSVSLDQIITMTTSDPATLLLADESVIEEQGIEGEERTALWTPDGQDDQLTVGVRSRGGVATVTLRTRNV